MEPYSFDATLLKAQVGVMASTIGFVGFHPLLHAAFTTSNNTEKTNDFAYNNKKGEYGSPNLNRSLPDHRHDRAAERPRVCMRVWETFFFINGAPVAVGNESA